MRGEKIIIHIDGGGSITQLEALDVVRCVVEGGRISESPMGKQYSYGTKVDDIIVRANKPSNTTDTFHLYREQREKLKESMGGNDE